ncbi:ceramide kinase isoform X4 [Heterodontus francisci]|uniref:ceramide kinase isoform X4 n=1 Tax=Heterodontus francisci TaxID=7792 RepID=UPI00355BCC0B
MERTPPLLLSHLLVNNQPFEVTLTDSVLSWQPLRLRKLSLVGGGSHSVPVCEIVAVRETEEDGINKESGRWRKMPSFSTELTLHAFTVYYVQRSKGQHWGCSELTFYCSDHLLCNQWVQTLKEQLDLQAMRPKHLIVFINPFGGKRLGKQIYDDKVAPLFRLACITAEVIVTERANHARDHLLEADLEKYDGIVSVGGDGMFSEVMHGLIGRTQKNSGIDENYPSAELVPCDLRIGIIPAGSTDCICYTTVGVNDPMTSALHIIVGDSQPIDVSSVHHKNMFLKYSVSLLGYGFYGDTLMDSEKNRWMGPSRYDFSGFKTFISHHSYEGAISYLPATETLGSPRDQSPCTAGCHICKCSGEQLRIPQKEREFKYVDEEQQQWKGIRGKFLAINLANMSCACPKSPKGLSPAAHLADGTIDLILVRKCSRFSFLRHLIRHTNNDDQFDLAFVEVHRVKKFKFTPKYCDEEDSDIQDVGKNLFGQICRDHPTCSCTQIHSSWNCDGEIIKHAAIEVRVHCQLLRLFVRGIEELSMQKDISNSFVV